MLHTWSWVIWLVAASVPAFTLRNPLYLALVLGAAGLVYFSLGRTSTIGRSWGTFARIGLFLFALTIPINALSIHTGQIVLFRLPETWPIVGGAITLEAVIAGAVSGLALFTILMVFATFNAVVDHYQLLRATPAFLFQAGVVISIAITFVPQMVLSAKEIREAQRIRGHRFRGIRDLLPLIMPLLASGLERAIRLAETMEARGFGSAVEPLPPRRAVMVQVGSLVALLALLAGLFVTAYFTESRTWGWVLIGLGVAGLLAAFRTQAGRVQQTRYRRLAWHGGDIAVVVACALAVTGFVGARLAVPEAIFYSPFPPNALWPPFQPVAGAALLLLAVPAVLAPRALELKP
ncbi:MAG: energy-coupling factor transporter transmembrane protein EcfT [Anaerolineae bacterium]|nr:energy-coupling factor transporter transmembrane protein EcfT [Anaerolineae bacterium]